MVDVINTDNTLDKEKVLFFTSDSLIRETESVFNIYNKYWKKIW